MDGQLLAASALDSVGQVVPATEISRRDGNDLHLVVDLMLLCNI